MTKGAARAEARALLAEQGAAALHARLAAADPRTAANLRPTDSQRLARAWEVWRGTGKGLADWTSGQEPAPFPFALRAILLDPPRGPLRHAIERRCDIMLEEGAIDEVRALLALRLDAALPAMRAHGVPEIAAYLRGETSLQAARARICLVTGQYTKRQATWLRHRGIAEPRHTHSFIARYGEEKQLSERILQETLSFICLSG